MITAQALLRGAARAYRTGEITWGVDWFFDPTSGCRCALGGIAYAADPSNLHGDPRFVNVHRYQAGAAVEAFAEYLATERGVPRAVEDGETDAIETVGGWNDDRITDAEIIVALEECADWLDRGMTA